MDDYQRYQKDRATVIAIIKYILYLLIAAAILYISTKVFVILFPFLIGFVLAKASRQLASFIMHMQSAALKRRHAVHEEGPEAGLQKRQPVIHGDMRPLSPARPSLWARLFRVFFPKKERNRNSRRTKISVVLYAILLVIVTAALVSAAFGLVIQANKVLSNLPSWLTQSDYMNSIIGWMSQFSEAKGGFLSPEQFSSVVEYLYKIQESIVSQLPGIASSVLGSIVSAIGDIPLVLFYIIVIIMSGFYFLTDSRLVFKFLSKNIKSRTFRHRSITLVNDLSTTLFRVLGGYMLLLLITFFEALIIFWIAGVDYAVILALITAVLDFMPVLGVSATMVPLMIYYGLQGNYIAILILIIGMAVITVIRRVIEPPILGSAMNMHPMATLFAMIFGVALWGAIGFLMGPVVLLILVEAFRKFGLDKKLREGAGKILSKFSE